MRQVYEIASSDVNRFAKAPTNFFHESTQMPAVLKGESSLNGPVSATCDESSTEKLLNAISYGATFRLMTFGEVIKGLRERAQLSKGALARASGLGVAARISEIEAGREPGISRAQQVARGLGLTLTEVVAQWEGIHLTRTRGSGRLGIGPETLGAGPISTDIPEPRLFGGLISAWEMLPAQCRREFVQHVVNYAASLASQEARRETGTDPKG
jgi:transcriptional regulator with XRE-family HTH domain